MRTRRTIAPGLAGFAGLAGLAGLVAIIGSLRSAAASCDLGHSGLLWSYPANGSIDVPIDADLIVTGTAFGLPTLNGVPLTMIEYGVYELGELAPATHYEIRWETAVIGFETASGNTRGSPQNLDARDLVVTRNAENAVSCALVAPQGCFDTGPPTTVTLTPPTSSVAWLVDVRACDGSVRTVIVPGGCGAPVIESQDRIVCARLRATNGAAIGAATELVCSTPDVPLETIPRSGTCIGSWPPADALTLSSVDAISVSGDNQRVGLPATEEGGCGVSATPARSERATSLVSILAVATIASGMRRIKTRRHTQRTLRRLYRGRAP